MADIYRKQKDLLTRSVAGETLLVPIRGRLADLDRLFTLNPVAARIWELLDGTAAMDDIIAVIRDEFDVEPARAEDDVREFTGQLAEAGLIEAL